LKTLDYINKILFEKEEEGKSLKLYYKVDILVQNFPDETPEEPEETPPEETPTQPTAGLETAGTPTESTMYEDIFKTQEDGEFTLPKEEVDSIQTLEDLIEYCTDKKVDGKKLLNDVAAEIVLSVAGVGKSALEDIINKGDKVFVDLDYGEEKTNSIGVRVNKLAGSDAISIAMKKNNNIVPGEFNIKEFNKQITFFRNSILGSND